jgi:hypothetical protein
MERAGRRQGQIERYCSTGQSPQRAVAPTEEEEYSPKPAKTDYVQFKITSLTYNQQDATFSRSIYLYKLLYMFQAVPPPIIKSTKLHIQRQVL